LVNISANELSIHPAAVIETTTRALQLKQRYGVRTSQGVMIGNSIEACTHLGRWDEGHRLVIEGSEEEIGDMGLIVLPAASMLESYTGNLEEVERLIATFEDHLADSTSVQDFAARAGCRATLSFIRGDYDAVFSYVEAAADAMVYDFVSPYGLTAHAAIWARNLDQAHAELERQNQSTLRNPWFFARRQTLEAGIAALSGARERALAAYDEALHQWAALEIPLGRAMCQMDFALSVGGTEAAEASAEAEAFFADAGNEHFVRRLQEARGAA
jgi:hypothetical protein